MKKDYYDSLQKHLNTIFLCWPKENIVKFIDVYHPCHEIKPSRHFLPFKNKVHKRLFYVLVPAFNFF